MHLATAFVRSGKEAKNQQTKPIFSRVGKLFPFSGQTFFLVVFVFPSFSTLTSYLVHCIFGISREESLKTEDQANIRFECGGGGGSMNTTADHTVCVCV